MEDGPEAGTSSTVLHSCLFSLTPSMLTLEHAFALCIKVSCRYNGRIHKVKISKNTSYLNTIKNNFSLLNYKSSFISTKIFERSHF